MSVPPAENHFESILKTYGSKSLIKIFELINLVITQGHPQIARSKLLTGLETSKTPCKIRGVDF